MEQRRKATLPTDFRRRQHVAPVAPRIASSASLSTDFGKGKQSESFAARVASSTSGLARNLIGIPSSSDLAKASGNKVLSASSSQPPSSWLREPTIRPDILRHPVSAAESFRSTPTQERSLLEFEQFLAQTQYSRDAFCTSFGPISNEPNEEYDRTTVAKDHLGHLLSDAAYPRVPAEWLSKWEAILKTYESARYNEGFEAASLDTNEHVSPLGFSPDDSLADSKALARLKLVLGHILEAEPKNSIRGTALLRDTSEAVISLMKMPTETMPGSGYDENDKTSSSTLANSQQEPKFHKQSRDFPMPDSSITVTATTIIPL